MCLAILSNFSLCLFSRLLDFWWFMVDALRVDFFFTNTLLTARHKATNCSGFLSPSQTWKWFPSLFDTASRLPSTGKSLSEEIQKQRQMCDARKLNLQIIGNTEDFTNVNGFFFSLFFLTNLLVKELYHASSFFFNTEPSFLRLQLRSVRTTRSTIQFSTRVPISFKAVLLCSTCMLKGISHVYDDGNVIHTSPVMRSAHVHRQRQGGGTWGSSIVVPQDRKMFGCNGQIIHCRLAAAGVEEQVSGKQARGGDMSVRGWHVGDGGDASRGLVTPLALTDNEVKGGGYWSSSSFKFHETFYSPSHMLLTHPQHRSLEVSQSLKPFSASVSPHWHVLTPKSCQAASIINPPSSASPPLICPQTPEVSPPRSDLSFPL